MKAVGFFGKQFWVVMTDHMWTLAGGCYYKDKDLDHALCHLARVTAQPGAELRLSAAGLRGGEVHAYAQAAQNAEDGLSSFGVERIDQAGDVSCTVGMSSL